MRIKQDHPQHSAWHVVSCVTVVATAPQGRQRARGSGMPAKLLLEWMGRGILGDPSPASGYQPPEILSALGKEIPILTAPGEAGPRQLLPFTPGAKP